MCVFCHLFEPSFQSLTLLFFSLQKCWSSSLVWYKCQVVWNSKSLSSSLVCLMIWYGFPGLWTECLWFTWNLIILNSDKFIHFCTYCFELGPKCESDVLMSHYLSSITLQLEGASLCNEWFGILWSYLVWIGKNNYCISITISIKVQYKCFICVIQVTASEPCSSNTISTEKK